MRRSSRHKSHRESKHGPRDYSDSEKEKDTSLKDRKGREGDGSRALKDSSSGEKRKHAARSPEGKDSKGEFVEESGASKRRKDRVSDGVNDRWNGGEEDSQKSKDSKSRRRDESSGKLESKHRDSSRKEGRGAGLEREKKRKEGKIESLVENVVDLDGEDNERSRKQMSKSVGSEEERLAKKTAENTELNVPEDLRNPEPDNQLERRIRKRTDGSGDWDKHQDNVMDFSDRQLSSRDSIVNDGKYKDEKYRDKYPEDLDRGNRHRDGKQRDERIIRDRTGRLDDKHLRDDKGTVEIQQKKSEPSNSERVRDRSRDRDHERERERDYDQDRDRDRGRDWDRDRDQEREQDREREHDRDRHRERNRDRDRDCDRDRDRNQDWERDRDRDRGREWERDRDRDQYRDRDRNRDRERSRDRNRDQDCDNYGDQDHGSHLDDRIGWYKDDKGQKNSPDYYEEHIITKSRSDKGKSHSQPAQVDNTAWRASPGSSSQAMDENRFIKHKDVKCKDFVTDPATPMREIASVSGAQERVSKYQSIGKAFKLDDNNLGNLSVERSLSSKASPVGLVDRSPSTSIDRRYVNKAGVRWSLDVEEMGRRSTGSNDARESSVNEDHLSRDLTSDKHMADDSSQADSSAYNRTSQSNPSSIISPLVAFRTGVESPFIEEGSRVSSSTRYKRAGELNVVRGQGNAWKGVPNWSSPLTNGFIPFQHAPPHAGFQALIPQFPSPVFGVRPSMEINHTGIPFHIPDADRFPAHLRPLGWPNMVDGPGISHLPGWDGNNVVFRDEPHMYGGPEWDQNRHSANGWGWEMSADIWKGQNGDSHPELFLQKEDYPVKSMADEALQRSQSESNLHGVLSRSTEIKRSSNTTSARETPSPLPNAVNDKMPEPSKLSTDHDDDAHFSLAYLSTLDISAELVHTELYDQFTILLNKKANPASHEVSKHVKFKDGSRTGPTTNEISQDVKLEDVGKAGLILLKPLMTNPLFPAIADTVHQRAMELYKKQKTEIRTRAIAAVPVPDQEMVETEISHSDEVKAEELVPCELSKEIVETFDDEKAEQPVAVAGHEEHEELGPVPSPEVQSKEEDAREDSPLPMVADEMAQEPEKSVDRDQDESSLPSLENSSQTAPAMAMAEDDHGGDDDANAASETDIHNSADGGVDEIQGPSGDVTSVPSSLPDGSPKACQAVMPESNESQSVILSRIHHSPESPH